MSATLHYVTDPVCARSWAAEPLRLRLLEACGDSVSLRPVMGGLARELDVRFADGESGSIAGRETPPAMVAHWLEVAAESGMPVDPRLWTGGPPRSTYPACLATRAAAEQGPEAAGRYLRALRLEAMCRRRRLDHSEPLVAVAETAGLDAARFRVDLDSHAIVESLGADLELARGLIPEAPDDSVVETEGRERLLFPVLLFESDDGRRSTAFGEPSWEAWSATAREFGLEPSDEPGERSWQDLLAEHGPLATRELIELSRRPEPVVEAELWALARDWRVRPEGVLTGTLWHLA